MFLINSHYPHFTATHTGYIRKGFHHYGYTFFRSYGVNLQSSLTRVLSSALVYSTRLPESVCGTVTYDARYEDFLGSVESVTLCPVRDSSFPSALMARRICLAGPPTGLNRDIQHPDDLSFSVPPSLITYHRWCRNVNLLSITYAFRPRLRDRLTLGRLTLPRKP